MTHQSQPFFVPTCAAAEQAARLREVLALVEEIAGHGASPDSGFDEGARLSAAYEAASSLNRRRYDALAAEIATRATAGVEALLANHQHGRPARAAAARLADELHHALRQLSRILAA